MEITKLQYTPFLDLSATNASPREWATDGESLQAYSLDGKALSGGGAHVGGGGRGANSFCPHTHGRMFMTHPYFAHLLESTFY